MPQTPKEISKFERTRRFFNSKRKGAVVTRKELLLEIEHTFLTYEKKADHYRLAFEKKGYLMKAGPGKYKVLGKIPLMTWSWIRKELYPASYP